MFLYQNFALLSSLMYSYSLVKFSIFKLSLKKKKCLEKLVFLKKKSNKETCVIFI